MGRGIVDKTCKTFLLAGDQSCCDLGKLDIPLEYYSQVLDNGIPRHIAGLIRSAWIRLFTRICKNNPDIYGPLTKRVRIPVYGSERVLVCDLFWDTDNYRWHLCKAA